MKMTNKNTPYDVAASLSMLIPAIDGAKVSHVIKLIDNYGNLSEAPVFGKKNVVAIIRTMMSEWIKQHTTTNAFPCEIAQKYLKRAKFFNNQLAEVCRATPIEELIADYNARHSGRLEVIDVKSEIKVMNRTNSSTLDNLRKEYCDQLAPKNNEPQQIKMK